MKTDSFAVFQERLSEKLNGPLPGRGAHIRMASPRYRSAQEPGEATRQGAVLILFYPHADAVYFPLILRPQYNGVHSGQMAFPGGRYEPYDKDLTNTALREAWEEVGTSAADITVQGSLSSIYIAASDTMVLPVVATVASRPDYQPDPYEVAGIWEISLPEIQDKNIVREGKIPVMGGYVNAPYYDFRGQKIWGATAMMISELLEIIEQ